MSTGDVNKNVQRTVDHLTLVNYPRAVSARRLAIGDPTEILPILHHVLLDFSPFVAAFVATAGFTLFSKDDASFTDDVFRLATKHFGLNPGLQARHFLSQGFVGAGAFPCLKRKPPP
jgi:centrosomal protein CEP44